MGCIFGKKVELKLKSYGMFIVSGAFGVEETQKCIISIRP